MKLQTLIEMAYPASFNIEEFKALPSFRAQKKYAAARLRKIGQGSARTVYEVDEFKVLKIARNEKGVAQNEAEGRSGMEHMYDIVAKIIEKDDDNWFWLEMERAKPVNAARFKQLTGLPQKKFFMGVWFEGARMKNSKTIFPSDEWKKEIELMWDNEFFKEFIDMLVNFSLEPGDFVSLKHFGEVDGRVVIIDYGFNKEVWESHYRSKTR